MPIHSPIETRRISQEEFKELASVVMSHVFEIHNEFGRFCEEQIYKKELANRMKEVTLEVPITLTHNGFSKDYFADAVVQRGGLFEFKTAENIHTRHHGQTLNYLLLLDLAHGKVINLRPESVGQRFVNAPKRLVDLRSPKIIEHDWSAHMTGAATFRDLLMPLISDWGAGLETALYEEALTHFLGGDSRVVSPVPVAGKHGHIASQRMRLVGPDIAFKITGLDGSLQSFARNALKLIRHTPLKAVHWANVTQDCITFTTLC
jgi:GxxExxY protein